MTIGNALSFIKRGIDDSTLRRRLNSSATPSELTNLLADEKLKFSADDFNDAFLQQLTLCREEEDADQLKEFKLWWDLLLKTISPESDVPLCGGCST